MGIIQMSSFFSFYIGKLFVFYEDLSQQGSIVTGSDSQEENKSHN